MVVLLTAIEPDRFTSKWIVTFRRREGCPAAAPGPMRWEALAVVRGVLISIGVWIQARARFRGWSWTQQPTNMRSWISLIVRCGVADGVEADSSIPVLQEAEAVPSDSYAAPAKFSPNAVAPQPRWGDLRIRR